MDKENLGIVIADTAVIKLLEVFGSSLNALILYGSYARGEQDEQSDVDIMLLLNMTRLEIKRYQKAVVRIASELSLKHAVEVSFSLIPADDFKEYSHYVPFYRAVEDEGVRIFA